MYNTSYDNGFRTSGVQMKMRRNSGTPKRSPRAINYMKNAPPWNNRAHVTHSKNNSAYHT